MYNLCMIKKEKLHPDDKNFFSKVTEAAFSNPFGEDRARLDQTIAGPTRMNLQYTLVDKAVEKITERVGKLEAAGKADVRLYRDEDRDLAQTVFLFCEFHNCVLNFDQLIQDQIKTGDAPCPVPFGADAISSLVKRGFTHEEALRFFAVFYQLRRAYYFINNGLIGKSSSMRTLRMHLWNNIFTHNVRWYDSYLWNRMEDFSTLFLGETGTGKGAAAAAIGRSGFIPFDLKKSCFVESFMRNFVSLNLSQYHEALIESELFGHKKGAFTGAIENHDGVFNRCTPHGSIFLDEIGDVSIPIQIKLLQVLQARTFSPVGSHDKLRFNGRVIAATNKSLAELRKQGKFRDDFFYRLCSDIIVVPPLRQRIQENPEELDILLANLMQRMTGYSQGRMVDMVRNALSRDLGNDYQWPGNVRELEQAVRRILISRHYQGASKAVTPDLREKLVVGIDTGTLDANSLIQTYCSLLYKRFNTYEEVARRTGLDRRTVKKYIQLETKHDK